MRELLLGMKLKRCVRKSLTEWKMRTSSQSRTPLNQRIGSRPSGMRSKFGTKLKPSNQVFHSQDLEHLVQRSLTCQRRRASTGLSERSSRLEAKPFPTVRVLIGVLLRLLPLLPSSRMDTTSEFQDKMLREVLSRIDTLTFSIKMRMGTTTQSTRPLPTNKQERESSLHQTPTCLSSPSSVSSSATLKLTPTAWFCGKPSSVTSPTELR